MLFRMMPGLKFVSLFSLLAVAAASSEVREKERGRHFCKIAPPPPEFSARSIPGPSRRVLPIPTRSGAWPHRATIAEGRQR